MERSIDLLHGLSDAEARRRLLSHGPNELPTGRRRGVAAILLEVVREPMFILLLAGGTLYFFLGDLQEALMLLGFVFVVMGITLYQEQKTERALEALRDLSSPRALVIREGRQTRIAGREVVPGDIVLLAEGDRVPADGVLLEATSLSVDESLLTGESVPVRKSAAALEEGAQREAFAGDSVGASGGRDPLDGLTMGPPGGDDLPFVYSGTLVVQGQAIAAILATGAATELGKIGKALETVDSHRTRLQQETGRLVQRLAVIGLALCVVVVLAYWLTRGSLIHGILAGITLAMATLPEEFPVVLTVFLALGAWRISKQQVLTRRIPAVETLGSATVLCVDKTGTLTMNRMEVDTIVAGEESLRLGNVPVDSLPEPYHELVEYAILASQRDPFDPMEQAMKRLGELTLSSTEHLHRDWDLVHEYPLSKQLLAMSRVYRALDRRDYLIAVKGAPEAVADLCHLDSAASARVAEQVASLADRGLRILGVARATFRQPELPGIQHDFAFAFLGLIGLADPIRAGVPASVRECESAGIRVIMITGDYPGTARNIAQAIGLAAGSIITGPELAQMDDAQLAERCRTVGVFARVVPEQKLRLVSALKAEGEIVAMTGDGVNDAPALKEADIGIAMGSRGTDVAREASDLVLLDDDFSSIVAAVRLGRRIYDNIRKAIAYILAVHIPIAGMSLLPVLFDWPLVLLPVHILFLELIIDPTCSVVFEAEPEEFDVMRRKPRRTTERLFSTQTVILSLLQGGGVLLVVLVVFILARSAGMGAAESRTVTFTALVVANLGLMMTNRSWDHTIFTTLRVRNRALWWVAGAAVVLLGAVLAVPALRGLFHFAAIGPGPLLVAIGAGAAGVLWFEALKLVMKRSRKKPLRHAS